MRNGSLGSGVSLRQSFLMAVFGPKPANQERPLPMPMGSTAELASLPYFGGQAGFFFAVATNLSPSDRAFADVEEGNDLGD